MDRKNTWRNTGPPVKAVGRGQKTQEVSQNQRWPTGNSQRASQGSWRRDSTPATSTPVSSIYKYKNGHNCPHCMWVQNKYIDSYAPRMSKPVWVCPPSEETEGATIFNSSAKMYYTFNCVLKKHSFTDLHSALVCATLFIEELHMQGIDDVRLLINSDYKKSRGEKEHLHALITMDSPQAEEKFIQLGYLQKPRDEGPGGPKMLTIADEPYPDDDIFDLDEKQCHEILRVKNVIKFIGEITDREISSQDSFYLFLKYNCVDLQEGLCQMRGKISFPPKSY